ncbi:hypothetical protein PG993_014819 [Apiospora rasikravindrae]|uniref:Nephrocystin 3-like N-terminal domain-containing protein n=1 Tax=Apiospora rasikravindrae TaxID=990691 RepID=A0ABR1RNW4_9PEZI
MSTSERRPAEQSQAMAYLTHALWDPTEEEFPELLDRLQPFYELLAARFPGSGLSLSGVEETLSYICRWRGAIDGISRELRRGKDKHMADIKMIWHVETEEHLETYGFIFRDELYTQWAISLSSALLSIAGPEGSGKTIVAGLIHEALRTNPDIKGVYCFVNCCPRRRINPNTILQSLLWSMFAQRPDTATSVSRGEGEWLELLTQADSVESYWPIFVKLARYVKTVWLVLDSVHDGVDGVSDLLARFASVTANPDIGFTLKLVITTRDHGILDNNVVAGRLTYTADDMDVQWPIYKALGELSTIDAGRVLPVATAAIQRMGGGLFWSWAVLSQLQDKRTTKDAIRYLERLHNREQLSHRLVARMIRDGDRRDFVLAVLAALIDCSTPVSCDYILARLANDDDGKMCEGRTATVEDVEAVLKDDLMGLFRSFNGNWIVPTRFLRARDATATAALRHTVRGKKLPSRRQAADSVASPAPRRSFLVDGMLMAALVMLVLGVVGVYTWCAV